MAVSKELLARYKEMKAKGIQITLSELKAQMEAETNNNETTSLYEPSTESISQNETIQHSENELENNNSFSPNSDFIKNTGYSNISTIYSTPQTTIEQPANNISNNENQSYNYSSETINNNNSLTSNQTITSNTNTNTTASSWTTTYSTQTQIQENSTASNNFNSDCSPILQTNSSPETYSTVFKTPDTQNSTNNIQQIVYPQIQPQQTNLQSESQTTSKTTMMPDAINSTVKKFAVIGYPLGHSLSTYIHNAGFKSLGINASYEILETPPETLVDRIKYFKTHNYYGFNVTIPLKLPITMFLDEVDSSADIVNAINTVTINPETKELKGYNTDVIGFKSAIPQDFTLCGKVAGVLGTGGAARAAITALAQSQVKEIKLYTRNVPNSFELLNYLRKTFPNVEFNTYQIERIRDLSDVNILVNTTPIGMLGRAADMTPVEENELRTLPPDALVYDVIYNPKKTVLLKLAQKYNYRTVNGVDMFIYQAIAAEQIWTGRTPDFKDMKIAALENL